VMSPSPMITQKHGTLGLQQLSLWLSRITTTTTTVLLLFVWDYPGELVPEETFTHPTSWSSSNLYHRLPSTTIYSIVPVQFMWLTIFLHNLSPCPRSINMHSAVLVSHVWRSLQFFQQQLRRSWPAADIESISTDCGLVPCNKSLGLYCVKDKLQKSLSHTEKWPVSHFYVD